MLKIVHVSNSLLDSDGDLDFNKDLRFFDQGPLSFSTMFERDYSVEVGHSSFVTPKERRQPSKTMSERSLALKLANEDMSGHALRWTYQANKKTMQKSFWGTSNFPFHAFRH